MALKGEPCFTSPCRWPGRPFPYPPRRTRRSLSGVAESAPVVLLIEDEPQMRRFLRAALENEAYRLVEVATAREGLAQAAGQNPDIILMDLGLPDGDGIDLTRRIREWARTPIVVISARGQERDKVAALDA